MLHDINPLPELPDQSFQDIADTVLVLYEVKKGTGLIGHIINIQIPPLLRAIMQRHNVPAFALNLGKCLGIWAKQHKRSTSQSVCASLFKPLDAYVTASRARIPLESRQRWKEYRTAISLHAGHSETYFEERHAGLFSEGEAKVGAGRWRSASNKLVRTRDAEMGESSS